MEGVDGESARQEEVSPHESGTIKSTEAPTSKKELKRRRKREAAQVKKLEKRAREKADKKSSLEGRKKRLDALTEEEKAELMEQMKINKRARMEKQQALQERVERAMVEGQRVVLDFSFHHVMNDKEIDSMIRQLRHVYSTNRQFDRPCQLHFTSVKAGTGNRLADAFCKIEGNTNWRVHMHDGHVADVLPKSSLVYLSADSPTTLDTLDPADIYIIGAFVDKNRHKGATSAAAEACGLRTARLPLDEHISMASVKVLTTNHVFEILAKVYNGESWKDAILGTLPMRKGATVKEDKETAAKVKDASTDEVVAPLT